MSLAKKVNFAAYAILKGKPPKNFPKNRIKEGTYYPPTGEDIDNARAFLKNAFSECGGTTIISSPHFQTNNETFVQIVTGETYDPKVVARCANALSNEEIRTVIFKTDEQEISEQSPFAAEM